MAMKNLWYIVLLISLSCGQFLSAQFGSRSVVAQQGFDLLPQEGIFIHQNSGLLFSGERLYYKVYCLDLKTKALSELSKIAYVVLVDEDQNQIFEHKIRLKNGMGTADFAIPAEAGTGSYKLIGYTSWMQSRAERNYFETDLVIINPYKVTPQPYLPVKVTDTMTADSILPVPIPVEKKVESFTELGQNLLNMSLASQSVQTRSMLEIDLNSDDPDVLNGAYSLSVKKSDSDLPLSTTAGPDLWAGFGRSVRKASNTTLPLPELRGELIRGRVLNKESGELVANRQVVLSLPGDAYILDIAQTDAKGTFYFNLESPVNTADAILQLLGSDKDDYSIELDTNSPPDLSKLEFPNFTLEKSVEEKILERSIHNQIENSYAIVKSDTVKVIKEDLPFYRNYQQRFFLDDYTRFNTLRETMVEIIDNAWIEENEGDPRFRVRPFEGFLNTGGLEPIVIIDGLFIQDHKDVVNYNSKEIRRISIARDRFMLGPKVYQGLIALETKTGEYFEVFYRSFLQNSRLSRPEQERIYYFQQHQERDRNKRIPDYRYQLLWEPHLSFSQQNEKLVLYSSDIKGDFDVELKGYTSSGKPVHLRRRFSVN